MYHIQGAKKCRCGGLCILSGMILLSLLLFFCIRGAEAEMKSPPPEKMDVFIIGDRVVDIAYNLGVLPTAMSVRASLWPMAKELKMVSRILGCPMCTTVRHRQIIPEALKELGLHRVIAEKSAPFCLYMPEARPESVATLLTEAKMDVTVDYVDFSKGLESAVQQTAVLVGREDRGEALIAEYKASLAAAEAELPAEKSGKKVIVFNGVYQPSTGRSTLRVEAPGGYADRFLLDKIGYLNVGDAFKPAEGKPEKGYYPVRKGKEGFVLDPLLEADPDAIVMTGDTFAVQKALSEYLGIHPEMAQVKALQHMAVYSLPVYADSSVLEYPEILKKWALTLVP